MERYRLNRRIIRSHRDSKAIASLLPTRRGVTHYDSAKDELRNRAAETLDEWRRLVQEVRGPGTSDSTVRTFAQFVAAVLCHPRELGRVLHRRADDIASGSKTVTFADEESWLRTVSAELLSPNADVRTDGLRKLLLGELANKRVVVFVDAPEEAKIILDALRLNPTLEPRLVSFAGAPPQLGRTQILVCDRSAEEGLNLQDGKKAIVFHDLPYDVGRIEQRIGRFDRLEGMTHLDFWTPTPVGPYERGWTGFVTDQVRIFERSVARLQYFLAETMDNIRHEMFEAGPEEAFERVADRYPKEAIDAQLKQLRRQEALDVTEWRDDELTAFGDQLSFVREEAPNQARSAIEGWLKALQFQVGVFDAGTFRTAADGAESRHYRHLTLEQGALGPPTLAPPLNEPLFTRWKDNNKTERRNGRTVVSFGPFTFDPDADSSTGSLLGIGHSFLDGIFSRMRSDDRSRSWALWRVHPGAATPEVYVRFDFSVEANLDDASPSILTWKTGVSLRRRADELFPVEHRRVWLDLDGQIVSDPVLRKMLDRPYNKDEHDRNLSRTRWLLANERLRDVVPDWTTQIRSLRDALQSAIQADPLVNRRTRDAETKLVADESRACRILRSRQAHAPDRERQSLQNAIDLERELTGFLGHGVRNPKLVIDNVGAVILAANPLLVGIDE